MSAQVQLADIYREQDIESKELLRPVQFAIMSLGHLAFDGFGLLITVLLPVIAHDLGFTLVQLGIISGSTLLCSSLGVLLMGSYSDRIRNKNYLLGAGLIALSLGIFLAGTANSFYILEPLAIFIGFCNGIYHPIGLSILTALTKAENRGKILGIHGSFGTVGMMTFPFVAGVITQAYS